MQEITSQISREAPLYTDQREKHVAVKGLAPGDVLEYATQVKVTKPLIPGQFWIEYTFGHREVIDQETLTINVPATRAVKLKNRGPKFELTTQGERKVYRWSFSNPKKTENTEDDGQQWKQARGLQDQPDLLFSSFASWDEIGRWYEGLQQERAKPTAEIQAKAAELTKGAANDEAKLRAIYAFVSTKFRYIGIDLGVGRYQPHSADDVLENGYGDCKDKHTLLAALLTAVGFKVYPALIDSKTDVDPDVPSIGQFDHVISVVELPSGRLWLDTTPEVAPFGFLLGPLRGKHALLISPGSPAVLAVTPANPDVKATQTFDIKAKLGDDGTLTGDAERTINGDDLAVLFRIVFRSTPMPQWKDVTQNLTYASGFAGDVSDVNVTSPEDTDKPLKISYKYTRKSYSGWENQHTSPPLPVIGLPDIKEGKSGPTAPIWLGVPGDITFHSTMELPSGYTLEVPKDINLKEDFAEYHATYSLKDHVLTTTRHLSFYVSEIPISSYDKYKAFRKQVENDHDDLIALTSPSSKPTSSIATAANNSKMNTLFQEIWALPSSSDSVAAQYENDARNALTQNDLEGGIDELHRAVDKDPKFVRAWLLLGTVLAGKRDLSGSTEAYRNAVSADPNQAVCYKLLGLSLITSRKYEDAVPVLEKVTKLSPKDSDAFANLGMALNNLKRYDQAATALSSAVELSSANVNLRLMLGNAYLGAGDATKARSAFDEALKLDSNPMILNDVAYAFADKNLDLETAKQYAEKAVHEEELASSKVQVDDIQSSDLEHTGRLAAMWDTLGWIYFRNKDFQHAEEYLKPAWAISQRALIGEHLGLVYEQLHQKQSATHVYQLALSSAPSGPESTALTEDLRRLGIKPDTYAAASALSEARTFHLPRVVSGTAQAEFYLIFGPGNSTDARFIAGTDSLRGARKTIAASKFNITLPGGASARLVVRAVVGCYQYSGCSTVIMTAGQARDFTPFHP